MTRRPLAPEVVQRVKDGLAAGLNPRRAAEVGHGRVRIRGASG